MSVFLSVGSAWKILPVTAHIDRQTNIVQGWPPVLPPLYGQVWFVFSIWTRNGRPTDTVQGWPLCCPPLWTGNRRIAGGASTGGGGGGTSMGGKGPGGEGPTGALCTGFTLVMINYFNFFLCFHIFMSMSNLIFKFSNLYISWTWENTC